MINDLVGFSLELLKVDLRTIEDRAPMPHTRDYGQRLARLLLARAVHLGRCFVKIEAVVAWDRSGNRYGDQVFFPAGSRCIGFISTPFIASHTSARPRSGPEK